MNSLSCCWVLPNKTAWRISFFAVWLDPKPIKDQGQVGVLESTGGCVCFVVFDQSQDQSRGGVSPATSAKPATCSKAQSCAPLLSPWRRRGESGRHRKYCHGTPENTPGPQRALHKRPSRGPAETGGRLHARASHGSVSPPQNINFITKSTFFFWEVGSHRQRLEAQSKHCSTSSRAGRQARTAGAPQDQG